MPTAVIKPVVRDARTKVENWAGYDIRFVEVNGEWHGVAKDVTDALGYVNGPSAIKRHVENCDKSSIAFRDGTDGNPNITIISEFGIYDLSMSSHKPEAKEFKRWVFNIIKQLRESTGLEGFEVFRMLDKEHQKQAMKKLSQGLKHPQTVDYIKANKITNKAVSNIHGLPKSISKGEMTPSMLQERQTILDDTVTLMEVNDKFGLGISISQAVYSKTETSQR